MPVDQKILDVLKLSKLKSKLPKNPKVVDIRVEEYVDTGGEDAFPHLGHPRRKRGRREVQRRGYHALKSAIRDRVFELGIGLWPYIYIAKQSELDEDDEE